MAVQSGKEKFSKDDIIEILKRNVSLYRDEKEFVDYIVNLSMYLMDQYYEKEGAAIAPSDSPEAHFRSNLQPMGSGQSQPPQMPHMNRPQGSGAPPPISPTANRPQQNQPRNSMDPPSMDEIRNRQFAQEGEIDPMEEFLQSAPPRPFGSAPEGAQRELNKEKRPVFEDDFPVPLTNREQKSAPGSRQPGERGPVSDNIRVAAQPLATPSPSGGLDRNAPPRREKKEHKEGDDQSFDVMDKGRTRVYRVVRPYRSSTAVEIPCQVCGGMVPSESNRCPTCGHII